MKVKEVNQKRVHDTDDEGLRRRTHEHPKVFAKFTAEGCAICERLTPPFVRFAEDEEFSTIRFLRLNSDENPVAKKIMQEMEAPFFVAYCQGRMLECDMLTEESQVLAMLQRLRAFEPSAS